MTRLFVCTGEASGDRLAAMLVREIERRDPRLAVRGICGPQLRDAGATSVVDIEELGIVGVWEALKAAPRLVDVGRRVLAALDSWPADLVLTVDNPGLNLWLARRARARGRRVVHWVSPQVWAWRPGRVHTVARSVDALMCLFPMEPALYAGTGLETTFTGHPLLDVARPLRTPHEGKVIGLAPGSRRSEIDALWPVFREVAALLTERLPGVRFVVPVAPTIDPGLLTGIAYEPVPDVITGAAVADAFIACSGTATLELAGVGTPMVVTYRTHPLTWLLGRLLVRGVRHLALPNVLAGSSIVPEHLQSLDPSAIADAVIRLLGDEGDVQRAALAQVTEPLRGNAIGRTADVVMRHLALAKARA